MSTPAEVWPAATFTAAGGFTGAAGPEVLLGGVEEGGGVAGDALATLPPQAVRRANRARTARRLTGELMSRYIGPALLLVSNTDE
jgi:hypothetical protein